MLKLYVREDCPYCEKVRRFLESHQIAYQTQPVHHLGTERKELVALEGVKKAEVPVLVDGDRVIQGSEAIIAHLSARDDVTYFGDPVYGLTRTLTGVAFSDAVESVKEALKEQGFGVLTEIDVKATLKKKLDADFRNYVILGACNPPLAFKAFTAEPAIGLLLPCNVVVTEQNDGSAVVSAIDPVKMFTVVHRSDLKGLATEVRDRLITALSSLG